VDDVHEIDDEPGPETVTDAVAEPAVLSGKPETGRWCTSES
jgi:hypothetical protein